MPKACQEWRDDDRRVTNFDEFAAEKISFSKLCWTGSSQFSSDFPEDSSVALEMKNKLIRLKHLRIRNEDREKQFLSPLIIRLRFLRLIAEKERLNDDDDDDDDENLCYLDLVPNAKKSMECFGNKCIWKVLQTISLSFVSTKSFRVQTLTFYSTDRK